ncbi:MAG: Uma2 family endonuclease [Methylorubrum extorquens]|jgi:Uma2 family endonuclease|nr:Uma2 family endonuclease [Methylorubrum extorquens]
MAEPAGWRMTPDEFFAWQLHQDERYELVDGIPILRHRMMTGSSTQHDQATVNIIASLHAQLRGSGCRPTTADIAIRTGIRDLRRPDVMVECAELVRDTYEAREPRLVIEVASPSTSAVDRTRKLEEYKRHPTLRCILLVETVLPQVLLYRRNDVGWAIETFDGLAAIIDLPEIGARLTLSDIYDGLTFGPHWNPAAPQPEG